MKLIKMLRNTDAGSRLYSEGVEYEVEDELADKLIASGDAEAPSTEPVEEAAPKDDEPSSTS